MKYKVGDRVKTNTTYGESGYSIGTIKRVDDSTIPYNIEFDGTELYVWLTENEFTIIEQLPFPIGTRVKCYTEGVEPFTGIFQGQSESITRCWAIERDDNERGGAQNNWWNWDKLFKTEPVEETLITASGDIVPSLSDAALEPAEPTGEFMYASTGYNGFPVVFGQDLCSEFIKTYNHKYMSIKNKIKMLMTGEPEKTLIKHGILTIDKELTAEGKQLFNDFIEKKFKDEFLKELYEVLKDEKVDSSAQ